MAARPPSSSEEAALSLTLAVIRSSPGPLLLLDGDLNLVAASASFWRTFDIDPPSPAGSPLSSLGSGEWNTPRFRALLEATRSGGAAIEAYEMDLERPGRPARQLIVHAERLVYLDLERHRYVVAVSDVTDLRASEHEKDEALRQNLVLLQEVRHRVANSLQIIASLLLQNARSTASDETRGHLKDAHSRVMSIAALERQLAGSGDEQVELRAHFISVCDSIAASMIADRSRLALIVAGSQGKVDARVSVSLSLIVTELVINALKHAFPDNARGSIVVGCEFQGPNWILSVTDDGIGMPDDRAQMRKGLGATIVEALARQLCAKVEFASAQPGTRVTVSHAQIALVDAAAPSAAADRSEAQAH